MDGPRRGRRMPPQAAELNPVAIRVSRRPDTGSSGQGRRGHAPGTRYRRGPHFARTLRRDTRSSRVGTTPSRSSIAAAGPIPWSGDLVICGADRASPVPRPCPATGTPRSPNTSEFSAAGTTSPTPRGTAQAVTPDPAQHSQTRAPGLPTARHCGRRARDRIRTPIPHQWISDPAGSGVSPRPGNRDVVTRYCAVAVDECALRASELGPR